MQYLILCVCFWGCAGELYISASQFLKPWDKLPDIGQHLLDYSHIKQYGWEKILDQIPEDEEFWIAAKANTTLTPFVSWEGCARWLRGPNCTTEIKKGGSIADCIEHCPLTSQHQDYLLLQDEKCRCVDESKADTCFETTNINRCNTMCLNNSNDRCGGAEEFVSVYHKVQHSYDLNKGDGSKEGNCVYVKEKNEMPTGVIDSCYKEVTRRYICNGTLVDHRNFLTWPQAFDECGKTQAQMSFMSNGNPNRTSYWTSLRRSFKIDSISQKGNGHRACVTVKKEKVHKLILQIDNCTRLHRYLYMSQTNGNSNEKGKGIQDYLWQLGVFVVFSVCVIVVSIICYCNGLKRKERRKSRLVGVAGVRGQALQSNEASVCPQESRSRYHTSVTLNTSISCSLREQPRTLYNEIDDLKNSVNSIYDRTLTSQQPLLIHCPENEYGFGTLAAGVKVPSPYEEDTDITYAVSEKRKAAPRNLHKIGASCNEYISSVSEEVSAVGGDISKHHEDGATGSIAASTTDGSDNYTADPSVSEATCSSQNKPKRLLIAEMEEKLKEHSYFTLEAIE